MICFLPTFTHLLGDQLHHQRLSLSPRERQVHRRVVELLVGGVDDQGARNPSDAHSSAGTQERQGLGFFTSWCLDEQTHAIRVPLKRSQHSLGFLSGEEEVYSPPCLQETFKDMVLSSILICWPIVQFECQRHFLWRQTCTLSKGPGHPGCKGVFELWRGYSPIHVMAHFCRAQICSNIATMPLPVLPFSAWDTYAKQEPSSVLTLNDWPNWRAHT